MRFIILGDIHISTRGVIPAPFPALIQHVIARDPAFVVIAGDATSGNPDDGHPPERVQQWYEALDAALAPLTAAGIPILPIAGNHDSYTPAHRAGYLAAWADLTERTPLPLTGHPPTHYALRRDGLHLALIHAVDQGLDADVERWLRAELAAAADAELRLVVGHVPLGSAMGRTNTAYLRQLGGLFIQHGVACYFAGHEHLVWDIGVDVGPGHVRQVIVGTPGARYTFPLRPPLRALYCRHTHGYAPYTRRAFRVEPGTGHQHHKVTFAEVTVDGPAYTVDIHAVTPDGLTPFFIDHPIPPDVARVIDLRHAQRGLNLILDLDLTVDGLDGPATRAAVRRFQTDEGDLTVDGVAGPLTRARIAQRVTERTGDLGPGPANPPDDPTPPLDHAERLHDEEIRWIQRALNRLADAALTIDGDYGPRTTAAMTDWQRDAGLPPTGAPDPDTLDALRAAFEALVGPRDEDAAALLAAAPARIRTRADTRWLQAALNHLIDADLVTDGLAGPATRDAVRAFQADEDDLAADGLPGPLTLARIITRLGG